MLRKKRTTWVWVGYMAYGQFQRVQLPQRRTTMGDSPTILQRLKRWVLQRLKLVEKSEYDALSKEVGRLQGLVIPYHQQIQRKSPDWAEIPPGSDYSKIVQRLEKLAAGIRSGKIVPTSFEGVKLSEDVYDGDMLVGVFPTNRWYEKICYTEV
jgi:hypothetical protein